MTIDWDQIGTLRHTIGGYDIRTDALWILVITAKQGHEGSLDTMHIQMPDGVSFGPDEIQALATRAARKKVDGCT